MKYNRIIAYQKRREVYEMSNNELLQGISKLMDTKLKPIYKRFDEMETEINVRFEAVDQKFKKLEERIDQVEASLKAEISRLDVRIDQVEKNLNIKIEQVEKNLNIRIDQVEARLSVEIHNLWLVMEGEVRTDIKRIVENFPDLKKMKHTTEAIEAMKADIDIHDEVISDHSEKILKLEKIS